MLAARNLEREPVTGLVTDAPQHLGPRPSETGTSSPEWAERRALRLLALHEVALTIGGQSEPAQTLELILTQARALLRAPAGSVYLLDESSGLLRRTAASQNAQPIGNVTIQPGEGAAGVAFRDCKTVLINNYRSWSGASKLGLRMGFEAAVAVPLRIGERLLGALTVHTCAPGQTFSEEDAWLLELLGDQASIALEQARLVEAAEQRAARLLALHRVSTAISAQADIRTTLDLILSQVTLVLKCCGNGIHLWDEASSSLSLAAAHQLPQHLLAQVVTPGDGIVGQVWLRGESLVVDNYWTWKHATHRTPAAGTVSVAGVPLAVAGRRLGVLTVLGEKNGPAFRPEQVQFLELFAGQAAVAIENARLFDVATRARALEQLDRLKSEFISTVSHELRTPLTYIRGYSELLKERGARPETLTQAIDEIHDAAVRMARLVDDLLDLSRLEAGRLKLLPRPVDLGELLQSSVVAARLQTPERQIELGLEPLPTVLADPDRVRQVVDNLLSNALRYAPSGCITIAARASETDVQIEVRDQGPGISAADQERVFEPFYRGANSEIQPLRGGGLGLTIVRRLVEAHGGRVGLVSHPGQGSTFWFTLPLLPDGVGQLNALEVLRG